MAKAKAKPKKKPKPRAKAKPKPKARPKSNPKPKAKANKSPAKLTAVEADASQLLGENEAGDIDNVWDIVDRLNTIDDQLPKTSSLYKEWKKFYDAMVDIMIETSAS